MIGTVVESRAARWSTASAPAAGGQESTSLVAKARNLAGSAAIQARVAERRAEEIRTRVRGLAGLGAAAAIASLGCAAVALVQAVVPDLFGPQLSWGAAAAAILFGVAPATLLARTAVGRRSAGDAPAAAIASATTLAALAVGFGRAIDAEMSPEVARAVEALLGVLETEVWSTARSGRPQGAAAPARRHRRIVPLKRRVVIGTADGRRLVGTIADVSLSGVALTASLPRIAAGDRATVGTHPAVVARIWERGIAFQFDAELDPETFDESIVL